jgi:hypothetical protein
MFIPDPGSDFFPSRIRTVSIPDPGSSSKNLSILTPKKAKKWFLSSKKYDSGSSSGIPDPDADFLPPRIPDPGVKKAPNPGSVSATLLLADPGVPVLVLKKYEKRNNGLLPFLLNIKNVLPFPVIFNFFREKVLHKLCRHMIHSFPRTGTVHFHATSSGRYAGKFRKSANLRTYIFYFAFFVDLPQIWQITDLRFADHIFFAICVFAICGPNCFCGLKTSANA